MTTPRKACSIELCRRLDYAACRAGTVFSPPEHTNRVVVDAASSEGFQEVETVWIVTSLTAEQADLERLLELARQYWSTENGTHYRLGVSAGEDRCRVRHPVGATTLGILRRAVRGEVRAWARRQPCKRDRICSTFLARKSRRRGEVIPVLTRLVRLLSSPAWGTSARL